jgi:hypothetical protein
MMTIDNPVIRTWDLLHRAATTLSQPCPARIVRVGTPVRIDGVRATDPNARSMRWAAISKIESRHAARACSWRSGCIRRVFMEVLGHSQSTLTMNTYGQVMPSPLDEAAASMEATCGSAVTGGRDGLAARLAARFAVGRTG